MSIVHSIKIFFWAKSFYFRKISLVADSEENDESKKKKINCPIVDCGHIHFFRIFFHFVCAIIFSFHQILVVVVVVVIVSDIVRYCALLLPKRSHQFHTLTHTFIVHLKLRIGKGAKKIQRNVWANGKRDERTNEIDDMFRGFFRFVLHSFVRIGNDAEIVNCNVILKPKPKIHFSFNMFIDLVLDCRLLLFLPHLLYRELSSNYFHDSIAVA